MSCLFDMRLHALSVDPVASSPIWTPVCRSVSVALNNWMKAHAEEGVFSTNRSRVEARNLILRFV